MSSPQHGDYHFDFYREGVEGLLPKYPVDFASLARAAAEVHEKSDHWSVADE